MDASFCQRHSVLANAWSLILFPQHAGTRQQPLSAHHIASYEIEMAHATVGRGPQLGIARSGASVGREQ